MNWTHILWLAAAGVWGFAVAALFADLIQLKRRWFLLPYTLGIGAFLATYSVTTGLDVLALFEHNLLWGLVGGVAIGAILVKNVLSQPASERGSVVDILWAGLVYGTLDGLFLTVFPVVAVWQALAAGQSFWQQVGIGALGILGSIYLTAAYHAGYREFRGPSLLQAIAGNAVITLAVLITGTPLTALISHAVMHIAAVLHGPETTVQLPPHHGSQQVPGAL